MWWNVEERIEKNEEKVDQTKTEIKDNTIISNDKLELFLNDIKNSNKIPLDKQEQFLKSFEPTTVTFLYWLIQFN